MSSHYLSEVAFTRGEKLGEGAFGTVYKAYDEGKRQRTVYAVKDIECKNNEDLIGALDEIRALGSLVHKNIIKLYNVNFTQTTRFRATISLLIEYCGGGDLNDRLSRPSSRRTNLSWMRQIINAVEFLHDNDIIHRDLKPQNILLTSNGVVKLADFGLNTRFARKDDNQTWYQYYIELGVGQSCYVAPEVLSQRYTYKADIFAVGVIFYAIYERSFLMVAGERLYGAYVAGSNDRQPLGLVMYNKNADIDLQFTMARSQDVVQLIKRTLKFDYNQRPTAKEIRETLERNSSSNCTIL